MSWLGNNGLNRDDMASLSDAYKNMYKKQEEVVESEPELIVDEYAVSEENGQAILEGKKKCKEGYTYDSDKKKCVKKKKKSSKKTVIIKNRGGGGYYGGLHGHGHGHGGGDGEDGGDGGDGGEGGGDGGGGGE